MSCPTLSKHNIFDFFISDSISIVSLLVALVCDSGLMSLDRRATCNGFVYLGTINLPLLLYVGWKEN